MASRNTRFRELRLNTPKNGQIPQQKSVRRLVFAIKNLHFDLKGPAFDSDRVHLGGIDARADQKDQKVDFDYPPPNPRCQSWTSRNSPKIQQSEFSE